MSQMEEALVVYDIRDLIKTYPGQTQPANKNITLQIVLDLTVLVGATLVVFWLVGRKMDWRQN